MDSFSDQASDADIYGNTLAIVKTSPQGQESDFERNHLQLVPYEYHTQRKSLPLPEFDASTFQSRGQRTLQHFVGSTTSPFYPYDEPAFEGFRHGYWAYNMRESGRCKLSPFWCDSDEETSTGTTETSPLEIPSWRQRHQHYNKHIEEAINKDKNEKEELNKELQNLSLQVYKPERSLQGQTFVGCSSPEGRSLSRWEWTPPARFGRHVGSHSLAVDKSGQPASGWSNNNSNMNIQDCSDKTAADQNDRNAAGRGSMNRMHLPCPQASGNNPENSSCLTPQQIDTFLTMALSYGVGQEVVDQCKAALLASNLCNVVSNYFIAVKFTLFDVMDRLMDRIRRNFKCIAQTEPFLSLCAEYVEIFLTDDDLVVTGELDVFEAALAWVDYNKQERISLAGRLLTCVRYVHIDTCDIINYVEPYIDLFTGCMGTRALLNLYRDKAMIAAGIYSSRDDPMLPPRRRYTGDSDTTGADEEQRVNNAMQMVEMGVNAQEQAQAPAQSRNSTQNQTRIQPQTRIHDQTRFQNQTRNQDQARLQLLTPFQSQTRIPSQTQAQIQGQGQTQGQGQPQADTQALAQHRKTIFPGALADVSLATNNSWARTVPGGMNRTANQRPTQQTADVRAPGNQLETRRSSVSSRPNGSHQGNHHGSYQTTNRSHDKISVQVAHRPRSMERTKATVNSNTSRNSSQSRSRSSGRMKEVSRQQSKERRHCQEVAPHSKNRPGSSELSKQTRSAAVNQRSESHTSRPSVSKFSKHVKAGGPGSKKSQRRSESQDKGGKKSGIGKK